MFECSAFFSYQTNLNTQIHVIIFSFFLFVCLFESNEIKHRITTQKLMVAFSTQLKRNVCEIEIERREKKMIFIEKVKTSKRFVKARSPSSYCCGI